MTPSWRALVTAGGTREPIDDVRAVANTSTGRFGVELARALAARGVSVTLLASREAARLSGVAHPLITVLTFDSFRDLAIALEAACRAGPDLILMAAAVADYSPIPYAGKRPSDAATWSLSMAPNPKLLDRLRGWCPGARIVGFKLVSGVDRARRIELAARQNQRAGLDYTVVNDARELEEGRHPVDLVDPKGESLAFDGPRADVARGLIGTLAAASLTSVGAADPLRVLCAAVRGDRPEILEVRALPSAVALFPDQTCDPDDPDSVRLALARAARAGRRGRGSFMLANVHGGALLGLVDPVAFDARANEVLVEAAAAVAPGLAENATDLDAGPPRTVEYAPVLVGARVAGFVVRSRWGDAPFVASDERRQGVGDLVVRALEARRSTLAALESTGLGAYYLARGHLPGDAQGSITAYVDPRSRADLVRSASVCLYEPRTQRVLVGRRTTAQWRDHWSFPGGVLEPGETELAAACREVREETGVAVDLPYPIASATVYAARNPAGPVYRITNFLCYAPAATPPVTSSELDAAWIPAAHVAGLRPMAAGTRRVWAIYGLGGGMSSE